MMKKIFFCVLICCLSQMSALSKSLLEYPNTAQPYSLLAGLRFQKAAGFYWTNGIILEYKSQKIWKEKISFGLNFVTSRAGTALASNAIPYSELNISSIKYFRGDKPFKTLVRLNLGFAHANYGSAIFKDIPANAALLSFESGFCYDLKIPLRMALAGGYNFIAGDGLSGLGLIYPIFAQFSVLYKISLKK